MLRGQSCSPHWDTRSWCFVFACKAFLSTIFLVINAHMWNRTNFNTSNNLHSYCYGHNNHVLHIRIHDIEALDLQEKLFFPLVSLLSKFICKMRQILMLIIISILFVMDASIMFSTLRCTILMLWICNKCFSFHHFSHNQSSSMKWYKLGYS